MKTASSLAAEISASALKLATDSYDMSVGEMINIYRDGDLVVTPEFQRLFRWSRYQKSHLIESLLIGVPIPSIFVFELEDGKWELIDGLQRVSTILEFVGVLRRTEGELYSPFVAEGTRYLPSLDGVSWEGSEESSSIGANHQIAIKRARLTLQILKKTSDEKAKYDLFQRLNSHGSQATPQELRNCIIFMFNKDMLLRMKELSADKRFVALMQPSDKALQTQSLLDTLTRFLVFAYVEYDKAWDIEEYLDNGIIELSQCSDKQILEMLNDFETTLALISQVNNNDILKRHRDGKFQGRVGQAAFEIVFLGVAQNLTHIQSKKSPGKFILDQTIAMWGRPDVINFTRAGLRGTDRIKQTIAFGDKWYAK